MKETAQKKRGPKMGPKNEEQNLTVTRGKNEDLNRGIKRSKSGAKNEDKQGEQNTGTKNEDQYWEVKCGAIENEDKRL